MLSTAPNADQHAASAPRVQRSTVHHHRATGLWSMRANLIVPRRMRSRQCADEAAEGVAAHLEIGELVEGGAGRRQQHHGAGNVLAARAGREAAVDCRREVAAAGIGDLAVERRRELLGRVADQEGVPHALEIGRERRDPAFLGKAAGDPVDRW